jgi:hypothetical protein
MQQIYLLCKPLQLPGHKYATDQLRQFERKLGLVGDIYTFLEVEKFEIKQTRLFHQDLSDFNSNR